jgi:hypothetical protein
MGRRRRGRRRQSDGQPGQPRFGPDGSPRSQPLRGPGAPTSTSQEGRWTPSAGPQGARRPYEGRRSRWTNGQQRGNHWTARERGTGPQYAQAERWAQESRPLRRHRPAESPAERRRPHAPPVAQGGTLDPFELFCAYHLGITADGRYRIQNIHEVARRFGTNAAALKQTLGAYGMEADDIVHSGFDLASAQIDIMVAPEGISRRELARPLYAEFKNAPRRTRDWARELQEAERQIERTIGRDGPWSPGPRDPTGKQS